MRAREKSGEDDKESARDGSREKERVDALKADLHGDEIVSEISFSSLPSNLIKFELFSRLPLSLWLSLPLSLARSRNEHDGSHNTTSGAAEARPSPYGRPQACRRPPRPRHRRRPSFNLDLHHCKCPLGQGRHPRRPLLDPPGARGRRGPACRPHGKAGCRYLCSLRDFRGLRWVIFCSQSRSRRRGAGRDGPAARGGSVAVRCSFCLALGGDFQRDGWRDLVSVSVS